MHAAPSSQSQGTSVAIYARVSTTKQVGGRYDSCDAQIEACKNYIQARQHEGWTLFDVFSDPAYSGKDLNRPEIQRLIKVIESGLVQIVVIYRLERVLRSTDEWAPLRKLLKMHRCTLLSTTQDIEDESPEGRLRNNMLVSISEYERNNVSVKTKNKMRAQAARGYWNGGNEPYGYKNNRHTKSLSVIEDEAIAVRSIFEMARSLKTLSQIAQFLHNNGIKTRERSIKKRKNLTEPYSVKIGGNRFREEVIHGIITNPIYRGYIRFEGKEYKGQHEAIVSQELWEAANASINIQNSENKPPRMPNIDRDKNFNVLKGLLYCGCCKGAFVPHASGKRGRDGKHYRYYACSRASHNHTQGACAVRQISAVAVEDAAIALLGEMAKHPSVIEAVIHAQHSGRSGNTRELEATVQRLDREIKKATSQLNNLVDSLAESGVAALHEEIRAKVQAIKQQKDRAVVDRERAHQELQAYKQEALVGTQVRESLEKFSTLWPVFTQDEKRSFVRLMVSRITINKGGPGTDSRRDPRLIHLNLKLHLPALLGKEVGGSPPVRRGRGRLVFDSIIQLASGKGDTVILSPIQHTVPARGSRPTRPNRRTRNQKGLHPIHHALALAQIMATDKTLTQAELARMEGLSRATVSVLLKIARLSEPVRQRLLALSGRQETWRCGIRQLLPLVDLDPQAQMDALESMLA